ncbi:hypothetical protein ACROYT_G031620, partial [Oculina patagonica]
MTVSIATTTYPLKLGISKMEKFLTLDNVSIGDIFPNVSFELFPQSFWESEDSLFGELSTTLQETQSVVTAAPSMSAEMQRTEELQQQKSTPAENISETLNLVPQIEEEDQSRFPVVSNEEITEIN